MNVSLNIILDRLSDYNCEQYMKFPTDRVVCGVKLIKIMKEDPDTSLLYVSPLSNVLSLDQKRRESAVFICLRDLPETRVEIAAETGNLVIVNDDIAIEELFSVVQDTFYQISTWYQGMMEAIIKNLSFQELIDLSEGILKNYVQITDSSFKLLGYTRHTECDEEITVLARKYGFHPESTIKIFEKYHRFDVWENTSDILVNDEKNFSKYSLVSKVFRFSNTYFAHAAMVCNNVPLSDGLIDLFRMFSDLIGIYVEKFWESTRAFHHIYDTFLKDLYDGTLISRDIVEERSRHVGIPIKGCFYISTTSSVEGGRYSPEMIAKEFSLERPDDKIVVSDGRITVLSIFDKKHRQARYETLYGQLEEMLEKYDIRCGISSVFFDLMDAPRALDQARHALSCSGRTPGADLLPKLDGAINGLEKRAVRFEESFCYVLLGATPANRDVWRNSVYYEILKMLDDYDKQHGMNNLHMLYIYLQCESRLAETGARLHMSRNNAAYRIDRIEQMIGMDLKSSAVRESLMIAYLMLQLYGFD